MVVDTSAKKVQHPSGGIVGEIRVRDGDQVKAGDLLVRLDETVTRANLAIVTNNLNELSARKARLEAERDDASRSASATSFWRLQTPIGKSPFSSPARARSSICAAWPGPVRSRCSPNAARSSPRRSRATRAKSWGKRQEIELIGRELTGARELFGKNLMPITKMTALERDGARLHGERAQLLAAIAQGRGKIAEIELQILQIDRDAASEIGKELREIEGKIGELVERKVTAEDQMRRIDIRAPQDGLVHQSIVHTVGGVISPGEQLMLIVPESEKLIADLRVAPQDIDQLWLGQPANLRFPAFDQRTTPEIDGTVTHVSLRTSRKTNAPASTTSRCASRHRVTRSLGSARFGLCPVCPSKASSRPGNAPS